MMRVLLAAVLWLVSAPAFAQTPCDLAAAQLAINPSKVFVVLPFGIDDTDIDGGPVMTHFSYALFAEGADPATATPVQGPTTVPKAAFTAVSGSNCFMADLPAAIPMRQRLVGAVKAMRAARTDVPAAESPWSPVSNPFGAILPVLPGVGPVRFRQ